MSRHVTSAVHPRFLAFDSSQVLQVLVALGLLYLVAQLLFNHLCDYVGQESNHVRTEFALT